MGIVNTGPTLRETAEKCCKKVYIGAAVLPKPLFVLEYDDEYDDPNEGVCDENLVSGELPSSPTGETCHMFLCRNYLKNLPQLCHRCLFM